MAGRQEPLLDGGEFLGAEEIIGFVENEARPVAADLVELSSL
jgi:hypothetical protein